MRTFLLVIHILAAGAWIGANVTQAVVTPRIAKQGGASAATWMQATVTMGRVLYSPAAVVLLVTGFALVLRSGSPYEFEQAFVIVGIAVVVVATFLGIRVFGPGGQRAAAAFEAGNGDGARQIVGRLGLYGLLDTVLAVVAVTAMVAKWGV